MRELVRLGFELRVGQAQIAADQGEGAAARIHLRLEEFVQPTGRAGRPRVSAASKSAPALAWIKSVDIASNGRLASGGGELQHKAH